MKTPLYLKKEMISFLSFADFNISDIKIREIPNPVYEQIFKLLRHDLVENLNVDSLKNHKELYTYIVGYLPNLFFPHYSVLLLNC